MGKRLAFEIPGVPVAKGRPRVTSKGWTYTPKKTIQYEHKVRLLFAANFPDFEPIQGPVSMTFVFLMPLPKSWSKKKQKEALEKRWHIKRPDTDNLIKAIKDALNGLAYIDDSQVCREKIFKQYANEPRVEIILHSLK